MFRIYKFMQLSSGVIYVLFMLSLSNYGIIVILPHKINCKLFHSPSLKEIAKEWRHAVKYSVGLASASIRPKFLHRKINNAGFCFC
jgi:hypothetical protein